jgi:hypothetical protein
LPGFWIITICAISHRDGKKSEDCVTRLGDKFYSYFWHYLFLTSAGRCCLTVTLLLTFWSRDGVAGRAWPVWQVIESVQSVYQAELLHVRVAGKYGGYLAQRTVPLQSRGQLQ